jgi:PKD repeat protein
MADRKARNWVPLVVVLAVATCSLTLKQLTSGSRPDNGPAPAHMAALTPGPVQWRVASRPVPAFMPRLLAPARVVQLQEGADAAIAVTAEQLATTTIFSDDFEGSFPGSWQLYYSDGTETTTYWGRSSYRKAGGNYSAWCAGGGPSPQPAGGNYVPNMGVWLEYGPFDLSDASDATAAFDLWSNVDAGTGNTYPDYIGVFVSTDDFNTNGSGFYYPNTGQAWQHETFSFRDVTSVPSLGAHQVYIAFIFSSDNSIQYEGSYIDNFVLTKTTTGPSCSLTCTATVPATGTTGTAVSFAGSATPSNCSGTPTYSWDFGDGSSSTQQNPSHTYASAGSYTWTLTTSVGSVTCSKSGSITISSGQQTTTTATSYTYWLPVASHASGAQSSVWRTDLGVLNLGATAANISAVLHPSGGTPTGTATVSANAQAIYTDIVGQLGYTGSAALSITSDQRLYVTSRTYNQAASGTFGQDYDSIEDGDGAFAGELVYLPQLTENASYRTNISLTNTGGTTASVLVELFNGAGSKLTDYTVSLNPGEWKQENRPFSTKASQTAMASGYARVTVNAGTGILASASVIDNATNDPTTIPMKYAPTANLIQWLPVISHASGAQSSVWRTDLSLLNLGTSTATAQMYLYPTSGQVLATEIVPPGSQTILADVAYRFNFSGGSASLSIASDQPVVLSSRTYNQGSTGTFGQDYVSSVPSAGAASGGVVYLPQLIENGSYRTNIALTNSGPDNATATVELFAGGTKLTDYTVSLNPGDWKQENRPFYNKASQTNMAYGYAKITVTTGSSVLATASVIDNATNDPTTVPMKMTGTATLTGHVTSTSGATVAGATISAGGRTAVTDSSGAYTLSGVPAGPRVSVNAGKTGYVNAAKVAGVTAGQPVAMDLTMAVPKAVVQIPAASGGSATTSDGGAVTLPANALARSGGAAFSGTATVNVTTFDPTLASDEAAMPGDSSGDALSGTRGPFLPFGAMDVTVTDGSQPLQLASGKSAALQVPIPASLRGSAPALISLWWYNPADARWHEQGTGTKSGNFYLANVSHLSGFAWAAAENECEMTGRLLDMNGQPVSGATVWFAMPTCDYGSLPTGSDGRFYCEVPAGQAFTMKVELEGQKRTVTTGTSCSGATGQPMNLGDLTLSVVVAYSISGDTGEHDGGVVVSVGRDKSATTGSGQSAFVVGGLSWGGVRRGSGEERLLILSGVAIRDASARRHGRQLHRDMPASAGAIFVAGARQRLRPDGRRRNNAGPVQLAGIQERDELLSLL